MSTEPRWGLRAGPICHCPGSVQVRASRCERDPLGSLTAGAVQLFLGYHLH